MAARSFERGILELSVVVKSFLQRLPQIGSVPATMAAHAPRAASPVAALLQVEAVLLKCGCQVTPQTDAHQRCKQPVQRAQWIFNRGTHARAVGALCFEALRD